MYGYKIENGTIVVVEDEADIIRSIFKNYLLITLKEFTHNLPAYSTRIRL